jgi:uncharacterized protein
VQGLANLSPQVTGDTHVPSRLALVTGASSGIGEAFARRLAEDGNDLLLVARRSARLDLLARELEAWGVSARTMVADLSAPDDVARLMDHIEAEGRAVDILVNSAGYFQAADFQDWNPREAHRFLQLMLITVCELTRFVIPQMKAQGYGRILNVASLQGLIPGVPGHSLYSGVKGFLVKFSEAIHYELRDAGVHVTALCPGLARTEFFDQNNTKKQYTERTPRWAWQSTDQVVGCGLRALEANKVLCVPGLQNKLIAAFVKAAPTAVSRGLVIREAWRFR